MVHQYLSTSVGDFSFLEEISTSVPSPSNPVSPKKRQRYVPMRDSQARFSRVGKPGSKRFQRYMNDSFLHNVLDLEPEDFQLQSVRSTFSLLFEEQNEKKWAPFVDITEEEQDYLLFSMNHVKKGEEEEDEFGDFVIIPIENMETKQEDCSFHPETKFRKVDKKIRRFIQKNPTNPFLLSMDEEIVKYIEMGTFQPKIFSFDQSFQRMICHGICQFYSLNSFSRENEKGSRVVTVRKPLKGFSTPSITLSIFLQKL